MPIFKKMQIPSVGYCGNLLIPMGSERFVSIHISYMIDYHPFIRSYVRLILEVQQTVRKNSEYEEKKGPNTIFGIGGFYFCSETPDARIDTWTKTLQPVTSNFKREGLEIFFGCQKLRWLTRESRERIFGDMRWNKRTFLGAEICGVRLLAESLTTAQTFLEQADFEVKRSEELNALIATDTNSAFTLVIEQGDSTEFLSSLNALNPPKT